MTVTRVRIQCCFTSTETVRTVRDGEPRTATSTFTHLLSSALDRGRNTIIVYRRILKIWVQKDRRQKDGVVQNGVIFTVALAVGSNSECPKRHCGRMVPGPLDGDRIDCLPFLSVTRWTRWLSGRPEGRIPSGKQTVRRRQMNRPRYPFIIRWTKWLACRRQGGLPSGP